MPKTEQKVVLYEDSAEYRDNIKGWVCTECRRFHGNDVERHGMGSEYFARWCCATSLPCGEEGCEGRAERSWTKCGPCVARGRRERYLAKTEVEWDGEFPIYLGERYLFDIDSLEDELRDMFDEDDNPVDLATLEFELCCKSSPPSFEMNEFLCDYLPDDWDVHREAAEIDRAVNDWIAKHMSDIWETNGQRPTTESVRKWLSDDWDRVED